MAASATVSIAGLLDTANMVITNSRTNPRILELVAPRGYNASEFAVGQELQANARNAVEAKALAGGAVCKANDTVHRTRKQARHSYQQLAQTVRAVFPRSSPQRKMLDIAGGMPAESAEFITKALTLFNNAIKTPEIVGALQKYGYHSIKLQEERDVILAYTSALQARAQARSAAKRTTREQTAALADLRHWLARYLTIAKLALQAEPELLTALEVATPSLPLPQRGVSAVLVLAEESVV